MGIPAIWASSFPKLRAFPSHITLAVWVKVRVTGDAISLEFWEWGYPKRGDAIITVTPGQQ